MKYEVQDKHGEDVRKQDEEDGGDIEDGGEQDGNIKWE